MPPRQDRLPRNLFLFCGHSFENLLAVSPLTVVSSLTCQTNLGRMKYTFGHFLRIRSGSPHRRVSGWSPKAEEVSHVGEVTAKNCFTFSSFNSGRLTLQRRRYFRQEFRDACSPRLRSKRRPMCRQTVSGFCLWLSKGQTTRRHPS